MKILHVNDIANVGSTLVGGLCQLGHNADLLHLQLAGKKQPTALKLFALPNRLMEMNHVIHRIRRSHYNIVHIHYAYLGLIGILGRIPYFLHCHGTDVRTGLVDPVRRLPVLISLKRAKKVFFSTPDLAEIVTRARPDALFFPNPVDTSHFSPIQKESNQSPRVLLISAIRRVKGVELAFKAVEIIRSQGYDITISAIDYGDERRKYYATPGIEFLPPVSYEDMPKLINAYDIIIGQFALGSLGMAELESMACGKPVICYFNYNNWYPSPPPVLSTAQPEQIADFILQLMKNPIQRKLVGNKSRIWVKENHDQIAVAKKLLGIYLDE